MSNCISIPLTNRPGLFTLISEIDHPRVSRYRWRLSANGYAVANMAGPDGESRITYLHRFILDPQPGYECDHVFGDKLDNRREVLRVVSRAQNQRNKHSPTGSTTGFRGVTRTKHGTYEAHIRVDNRLNHLGTYADLNTAVLIRDAGARRLHGNYAVLNYPEIQTPPEIDALLDQLFSRRRPAKPEPVSLGKSSFRGVYSDRGRWRAKISAGGRDLHLGYFDNEIDAAEAYDQASLQYHARPKLNFPLDDIDTQSLITSSAIFGDSERVRT